MAKIEGSGLGHPLESAGAPVAGTAEVQTLTIGGTPEAGDTFVLSFGPFRSAPIDWSATNATLVANIDAALEALPGIGTGGVTTAVGTATAGVGTFTITFAEKGDKPLLVASDDLQDDGETASAGTFVVAETTPGVAPTGYGSPKGAVLVDTTNGIHYINTGTAAAPTWTKTGTQT
jgi:hypothetical protein